MRLIGLELECIHQAASDGGKGVSVEIAERSQPMALSAQIRCFIEEHLSIVGSFPKLAGSVVAVASGFVERLSWLAKRGVRGGDELPVVELKPRSFHGAA